MRIIRSKNKSFGFTLIELLVVIAIIGILAAVVLVSLSSARAKARDSNRVSAVRQMQTALELYYNDCGEYPAALTDPTSGITNGCPAGSGISLATYLPQLPTNPNGCTVAGGANPAGSGTAFGYTATSSNTSYTIYWCSEGGIGGTPITSGAGGHTATPTGMAQ